MAAASSGAAVATDTGAEWVSAFHAAVRTKLGVGGTATAAAASSASAAAPGATDNAIVKLMVATLRHLRPARVSAEYPLHARAITIAELNAMRHSFTTSPHAIWTHPATAATAPVVPAATASGHDRTKRMKSSAAPASSSAAVAVPASDATSLQLPPEAYILIGVLHTDATSERLRLRDATGSISCFVSTRADSSLLDRLIFVPVWNLLCHRARTTTHATATAASSRTATASDDAFVTALELDCSLARELPLPSPALSSLTSAVLQSTIGMLPPPNEVDLKSLYRHAFTFDAQHSTWRAIYKRSKASKAAAATPCHVIARVLRKSPVLTRSPEPQFLVELESAVDAPSTAAVAAASGAVDTSSSTTPCRSFWLMLRGVVLIRYYELLHAGHTFMFTNLNVDSTHSFGASAAAAAAAVSVRPKYMLTSSASTGVTDSAHLRWEWQTSTAIWSAHAYELPALQSGAALLPTPVRPAPRGLTTRAAAETDPPPSIPPSHPSLSQHSSVSGSALASTPAATPPTAVPAAAGGEFVSYTGVVTGQKHAAVFVLDSQYELVLTAPTLDSSVRSALECGMNIRIGCVIECVDVHPLRRRTRIVGFGCCARSVISMIIHSPERRIAAPFDARLVSLFAQFPGFRAACVVSDIFAAFRANFAGTLTSDQTVTATAALAKRVLPPAPAAAVPASVAPDVLFSHADACRTENELPAIRVAYPSLASVRRAPPVLACQSALQSTPTGASGGFRWKCVPSSSLDTSAVQASTQPDIKSATAAATSGMIVVGVCRANPIAGTMQLIDQSGHIDLVVCDTASDAATGNSGMEILGAVIAIRTFSLIVETASPLAPTTAAASASALAAAGAAAFRVYAYAERSAIDILIPSPLSIPRFTSPSQTAHTRAPGAGAVPPSIQSLYVLVTHKSSLIPSILAGDVSSAASSSSVAAAANQFEFSIEARVIVIPPGSVAADANGASRKRRSATSAGGSGAENGSSDATAAAHYSPFSAGAATATNTEDVLQQSIDYFVASPSAAATAGVAARLQFTGLSISLFAVLIPGTVLRIDRARVLPAVGTPFTPLKAWLVDGNADIRAVSFPVAEYWRSHDRSAAVTAKDVRSLLVADYTSSSEDVFTVRCLIAAKDFRAAAAATAGSSDSAGPTLWFRLSDVELTHQTIDCYVSTAASNVLWLGIVPGAVVTFHRVIRRRSASGGGAGRAANLYLVTTPDSMIQLHRIALPAAATATATALEPAAPASSTSLSSQALVPIASSSLPLAGTAAAGSAVPNRALDESSWIGEVCALLTGDKPKLVQSVVRLRCTVVLIDRVSWRWTCALCGNRLIPFTDRCTLACDSRNTPPSTSAASATPTFRPLLTSCVIAACSAEATLVVDDGTGGPANIFINSLPLVRAFLNPTALLPVGASDSTTAASATTHNPLCSLSSTECDAFESLSRRFGELTYVRFEQQNRLSVTGAAAAAPRLAIEATDEYDPWHDLSAAAPLKASAAARAAADLFTASHGGGYDSKSIANGDHDVCGAQRDALFRRLRELEGRIRIVCYARQFWKRNEIDTVAVAVTSPVAHTAAFQRRSIPVGGMKHETLVVPRLSFRAVDIRPIAAIDEARALLQSLALSKS